MSDFFGTEKIRKALSALLILLSVSTVHISFFTLQFPRQVLSVLDASFIASILLNLTFIAALSALIGRIAPATLFWTYISFRLFKEISRVYLSLPRNIIKYIRSLKEHPRRTEPQSRGENESESTPILYGIIEGLSFDTGSSLRLIAAITTLVESVDFRKVELELERASGHIIRSPWVTACFGTISFLFIYTGIINGIISLVVITIASMMFILPVLIAQSSKDGDSDQLELFRDDARVNIIFAFRNSATLFTISAIVSLIASAITGHMRFDMLQKQNEILIQTKEDEILANVIGRTSDGIVAVNRHDNIFFLPLHNIDVLCSAAEANCIVASRKTELNAN